jgi:hypothetical protein
MPGFYPYQTGFARFGFYENEAEPEPFGKTRR